MHKCKLTVGDRIFRMPHIFHKSHLDQTATTAPNDTHSNLSPFPIINLQLNASFRMRPPLIFFHFQSICDLITPVRPSQITFKQFMIMYHSVPQVNPSVFLNYSTLSLLFLV